MHRKIYVINFSVVLNALYNKRIMRVCARSGDFAHPYDSFIMHCLLDVGH